MRYALAIITTSKSVLLLSDGKEKWETHMVHDFSLRLALKFHFMSNSQFIIFEIVDEIWNVKTKLKHRRRTKITWHADDPCTNLHYVAWNYWYVKKEKHLICYAFSFLKREILVNIILPFNLGYDSWNFIGKTNNLKNLVYLCMEYF